MHQQRNYNFFIIAFIVLAVLFVFLLYNQQLNKCPPEKPYNNQQPTSPTKDNAAPKTHGNTKAQSEVDVAKIIAEYKDDTPNAQIPHSGDGQITGTTSFGRALYNLAKQSDVSKFLEIGTWFGGGSTLSIANGLRDSGAHKLLITIELFRPAWDYARKRLRGYPVLFLLGGTVPGSKYLKPDEIPPEEKNEHYRLYYERDMKLADEEEPLLEKLCLGERFDAVLIDGNEYSGWAEFVLVHEKCKPKYIALHDVGTLKTRKISHELNTNLKSFYTLYSSGQDAAQWQIFERKK